MEKVMIRVTIRLRVYGRASRVCDVKGTQFLPSPISGDAVESYRKVLKGFMMPRMT